MSASKDIVDISAALERALLELVRDGGGKASWRWLATRLPARGAPPGIDMMRALKELRARGLLVDRELGNGMDAWAMTDAGRARLDPPREPGALDEAALAELMTALRGDAIAAIRALIPLASDGARMATALRQVLAADVRLAERVAFAGATLPPDQRAAFARSLFDDPRDEVRAALFRAWLPARTDVPGLAVRTLPDDAWDDLLRRGLHDPSTDVRSAAAALAFASDRGAALVGDLMIQVGAPEKELRAWAILALGAARDALSRIELTRIADEGDPFFAAAAVRALAARPDGHTRWLAALADSRPAVREAALFALAEVVTGLTPENERALANSTGAEVEGARAHYRRRTSRD